jgi:histidinol dehydrogenase
LDALVRRPFNDVSAMLDTVRSIFDHVALDALRVPEDELREADTLVPEALKQAIHTAMSNIEAFQAAQRSEVKKIETMPGVTCWQKGVAITAMACGTESIPKVYKLFGPGNRYVTAAKQFASLQGVASVPLGISVVTRETHIRITALRSKSKRGRNEKARNEEKMVWCGRTPRPSESSDSEN